MGSIYGDGSEGIFTFLQPAPHGVSCYIILHCWCEEGLLHSTCITFLFLFFVNQFKVSYTYPSRNLSFSFHTSYLKPEWYNVFPKPLVIWIIIYKQYVSIKIVETLQNIFLLLQMFWLRDKDNFQKIIREMSAFQKNIWNCEGFETNQFLLESQHFLSEVRFKFFNIQMCD